MQRFETGPVEADELDALAQILGAAFVFDPTQASGWFNLASPGQLRGVRDGGALVGGLMHVPMGMFVLGRRVELVGVAGVAVRPESRRTGAGSALMAASVRELRARRVGLSALYASNQPLYRRAGYAPAAAAHLLRVSPLRVHLAARDVPVRRATEADEAEMQALYRRVAPDRHGHLDRGPYLQRRLIQRENGPPQAAYVALAPDGRVDGYVRISQKRGVGFHSEVTVHEFTAGSAEAGRRLWTLLADHGSIADELVLATAPNDPLLLLLPDRVRDLRYYDPLMLRVVDVERALTERGYPAGVELSVALRVRDDLVPENEGVWRLSVADGRGQVARADEAEVELDVSGLASLYTGFRSPAELAWAGALGGGESALGRLATIFAAPPPWTPDRF